MKKEICFFLCGLFIVFSAWGQEQDEEEIRTVLLTKDDRSTKWHEKLAFIKKVKMGMPGGDNWLVEWKKGDGSGRIDVYAINKGEIVNNKVAAVNFSLTGHTEFNIMHDIPGIRIGDGSAAVYDYNGDGLDEIFVYGFYGSYFQIDICGYDLDKEDFVGYCNVAFDIVDPVVGPAPVEFMTYKGMNGFKVYFDLYNQSPRHPPKNIINKYYAWYFYNWDEVEQKYVEVEEVVDAPPAAAEPEKYFPPAGEPEAVEVEEDLATTKTAAVTSNRVVFFAAIAAALLAVGVLLVVLILRKRKKT
jgi:hypothetical protein